MWYWLTNSGNSLNNGTAPHFTGDDLKKFRKRTGATQADVAYHMGRAVKTIRHWESRGDMVIPDRLACRALVEMDAEFVRMVHED